MKTLIKIYSLIIILIIIFASCYLFAQPQLNPVLDSILRTLPPEKAPYMPIYLRKYDPETLNKMSREELIDLFGTKFSKFIADSGWKYFRFEPIFVYPGNTTFTPELLLTLKRVGHPKVSPNGKYLAYSVASPDIVDNRMNNDIFIIDLESRNTFNLTEDPQYKEWDYQWMPDGLTLAYISNKSTKPQIFLHNILTKEIKQITNFENGVDNFKISPDGKKIAFSAQVKVKQNVREKYPFLDKVMVRIYETLPVRHWDRWLNEYYSHIFIQFIDAGPPIDIMENEPYNSPDPPFGGNEQFSWSPDSKELAYTCKKVDNYAISTNTDIFIYNLETKTTTNITKTLPGYDRNPLYSPDGKYIAFTSMKRAGYESDRNRLMIYDRNAKKVVELSYKLDQWVGEFIWGPKSDVIYFSAEDGGTVQIYKINLVDGFWQIITSGNYNYDGGLDISPDGKILYYGKRNMLRPHEIFFMNLEEAQIPHVQLTFENEEIYKELIPVRIEEKWIKSRDGKQIHTWVLLPPNFDSTKKYPMILYCQGGPQSTVSQYFSYRWNLYLFASQGYIVVAPNRRGVPGFGQYWVDAINKDWGGKPMEDFLDVTDSMKKLPFVDSKRSAAMGASAGGYAVFWLAGNHKGRFSAFVSHCGVFNLESKFGSTEELWFPTWEFGGPYWEEKNKPIYEKHSPHKYAQNWDTPILISTGEKDFRVPYTQSLEAFTVAQLKNIPSKLIVFPNENHWILKPQEQILWYYEVFEFLERYCKAIQK